MIPFLAAALAAAAPRARSEIWLPILQAALPPAEITTPRRVAAFLGQCAIEAGPSFAELVENTNYTSPKRLYDTFRSRFRSEAEAATYVGKPVAIANRAYAWKNGNGDEDSQDGWRFRGSGLLQLTGRDNISKFAAASGRSLSAEQAAAWLRTEQGAAAGAVWYWTTHDLNPLADTWSIDAITLKINGPAMMHAEDRRAACRAALDAIHDAADAATPGATIKPDLQVAPPPDHIVDDGNMVPASAVKESLATGREGEGRA